jgi:hypothetical protein
MAKFEMWLDMNMQLVDGGAALAKVVLEGPDGTTWGTWPRNFARLAESITGMLGALTAELPKGKHAAKLLAFAEDGTQLSCFPMTVVGASAEASEGAQQQLSWQRSNALYLANVEKLNHAILASMEHNSAIAAKIQAANTRLSEDAERTKAERDESRLKLMREEGVQRRLDAMAQQIMPLVPLGLELLTDYAQEWIAKRRDSRRLAEKASPEPVVPPASAVDSSHAEAAGQGHGTAASDEPASEYTVIGNPQSEVTEADGSERSARDCGSPVGRDLGKTQKPRRGHENTRKERR